MTKQPNIEERYAELLIEVRDNVDSMPLQHGERRDREIEITMGAARALALAVLEEVPGYRGCQSSACGSPQSPDDRIWRCQTCRFRARIAALGSDSAGVSDQSKEAQHG